MPRGCYLNVICQYDRAKKRKKRLKTVRLENYSNLYLDFIKGLDQFIHDICKFEGKDIEYLNLIELAFPVGAN